MIKRQREKLPEKTGKYSGRTRSRVHRNGRKRRRVPGKRKESEKNMAGDLKANHRVPKQEIIRVNNITLFVCAIQEGCSGFRHRFAFDL